MNDYCMTCYHPREDAGSCKHPMCPICKRCNGTGWLHGAQDWSEKFIKKNGAPYYSVRCPDCNNGD